MISSRFSAIVAAVGPDGDPFAMFADWDIGQLLVLFALLPIAIAVFWYGSKQLSRQRGSAALRPRGRPILSADGRKLDARWREIVVELESGPPTPIARAMSGPVRLEATITAASGNLGGRTGYECVWRNRAGARADSAVAAEIIVVGDDSGRCGVENLETARVIAPAERHGHHWENVSLYLGDRVELLGNFSVEHTGDAHDPDPTKLVYGTLGAAGPLQVRLIERREPAPSRASEPKPVPESADP